MKLKKIFNNSLSLKGKIILITSLIMLTSSLFMGFLFYNNMYSHTTKLLQEQAVNITKSASLLIDGDKFESISKSLNPKDKYYSELRIQLQKLNTSIGNGMLYTIISNDNDNDNYIYIVDGSDANVKIGHKQKKTDFSNEAAMAFQTSKVYTSKAYYVESLKKYYISSFVPIFNSSNKLVGVIEYDYEGKDLTKKTEELKRTILLITCILLCMSIVINLFALKYMFKPIKKLVESMNTIAQGDLTVSIDTSRKDEIGKINIALSKTVQSLRDMIDKIKNSCSKVTDASQSILTSSTDTTKASEEIAISTNDISSISSEQVSKTETIKEVLDKLNMDIQNIFVQIKDANEISCISLENVNKGTVVIKDTKEQIDQIEGSINNVNVVVEELAKNMIKIQGILTTIGSIADQTNLLALNAAIEAARAGENGRGFAVVADEVRKLAVESNSAANEIVGIIAFINGQTSNVMEAISTSVNMTKEGKKYTDNVSNTFEVIRNSNGEIENKIVEITNSASEIVSRIENIDENMNNIENVSKTLDANTMNLASATEEQMASSEELKAMSEILNKESDILNESISKFKI